jgi:hypothetical protein
VSQEADPPPDLTTLTFVEIGLPFVKRIYPERTLCFSSRLHTGGSDKTSRALVASFEPFGGLRAALRRPDIAAVICHPSMFAPWDWRWLVRSLFNRRFFRHGLPIASSWGPQLLRGQLSAPVAVVDLEDLPVVNRSNLFLLDRSLVYFKRELPTDHWKVFLKTAHHGVPTPRYRRVTRNRARVEKLLPISIGLPSEALANVPASREKTVDIFFAGRVDDSASLRRRGLEELQALKERGVTLDIPETTLPLAEFYRRAASARLVWSPEGFGWDCFRHYEAAICGSVPLINNPTIERYRPLLAGEHAVYYDVEPGGLTRAVLVALADRPRLAAMAEAAMAHVETHHTPRAIVNYLLNTTLQRARLSGTAQER